jgi:hypothetical protein
MRKIAHWTEAEMLAAGDELDRIRERAYALQQVIHAHSPYQAPEYKAIMRAARTLLVVRQRLEDTAYRNGFERAGVALMNSRRGVPSSW